MYIHTNIKSLHRDNTAKSCQLLSARKCTVSYRIVSYHILETVQYWDIVTMEC